MSLRYVVNARGRSDADLHSIPSAGKLWPIIGCFRPCDMTSIHALDNAA